MYVGLTLLLPAGPSSASGMFFDHHVHLEDIKPGLKPLLVKLCCLPVTPIQSVL
jgi:hypothetical protein